MSDVAREAIKEWRKSAGIVLARLKLGLSIPSEIAEGFLEDKPRVLEFLTTSRTPGSEHYFHVRLSYFIELLKNASSEKDLADVLRAARDGDGMCHVVSREDWSLVEMPERDNLFLVVEQEIWGPCSIENKAFQALIIEARNAAKRVSCFKVPNSSGNGEGVRW